MCADLIEALSPDRVQSPIRGLRIHPFGQFRQPTHLSFVLDGNHPSAHQDSLHERRQALQPLFVKGDEAVPPYRLNSLSVYHGSREEGLDIRRVRQLRGNRSQLCNQLPELCREVFDLLLVSPSSTGLHLPLYHEANAHPVAVGKDRLARVSIICVQDRWFIDDLKSTPDKFLR